MEANNVSAAARNRQRKNSGVEETLTMRDILDMFLDNWVWFLISLIICVAGARLYLATKSNI